ncbi:HAD family hydrolase [Streptomyces beijiangensis]|uniref:HAD-IA family hydrolase n=1 Tax=Streptomyces beijiangensis TaxID=163361 RepID=A0A939FAV4_9ACTN|nr:HAD-IA family hydrolase [Streptomyces beijiangensis]MBO0514703.1 HAD-IA family hydrolase [Streptomyces beijiangensis]
MTPFAVPNPYPFDALLCDFDGVIRFYDTSEVTRLERAAGLPDGTTGTIAFAPERDGLFLLGKMDHAEWVRSTEDALTEVTSAPRAKELAAAFGTAPFRTDPEILALLARVRQHVPLVLVTNATTDLEADLTRLGLDGFVDHVVSSARIGVAKPETRFYEIAAARVQVPYDRCLFVDDSEENVKAATALGMTAVHYSELADLQRALSPLQ